MKIVICLIVLALVGAGVYWYLRERNKKRAKIVSRVVANYIMAFESMQTLLKSDNDAIIDYCEKAMKKVDDNSATIVQVACGKKSVAIMRQLIEAYLKGDKK